MPGLMEMLFGSKGKTKQLPTMDAGQQKLMQMLEQALGGGGIYGNNQAYGEGMNYLQDLYSQSPQAFARMQEPYMKQFQQQTVPGLAERFSAGGGRNSSGFNQAMGQAGANLQSGLAGMFEQQRGANLGNLMNMSNMPFNQASSLLGQRGFGYDVQKGGSGLADYFGQGLGSSMGMGFGGGMGNPASWAKFLGIL